MKTANKLSKLTEGDESVTRIAVAGMLLLISQGLLSPVFAKGVAMAGHAGYISGDKALLVTSALFVASIATAGLAGAAGAGAAILIGSAGM